ncbi:uncharacterized protein [Anabrus simplex]|uniref:uncharacterized protein isoform X2 n=1 Tax=Anabrus simplex TaxID=316456 RepID=UPI0035A2ACF0
MGSISVNHKPVVEKDGSRNGRESATPDEEHPLLLSEEFNSPELQELSTILFGMGLEKEEVLLFTMRNISLEKFLRLTDEDLQHVGITDPDKRRSLLYGINTLRSNNVKEQRKEEFIIQEHLRKTTTRKLRTKCSALLLQRGLSCQLFKPKEGRKWSSVGRFLPTLSPHFVPSNSGPGGFLGNINKYMYSFEYHGQGNALHSEKT